MNHSFLGFLFLCFIYPFSTQAQDVSLEVLCSRDTLLLGNKLTITYKLTGAAITDFKAPEFGTFSIAGGPNVSNSMSIVNGVVDQYTSYSYILWADKVGDHMIGKTVIQAGENTFEAAPIKIHVLDNPDGEIQNERDSEGILPKIPKKKRKTFKI